MIPHPGGSGGSTITAPDGNVIPPSVARYQTHLTIVDDQKTPRPNEPVKIWADVAGTVITVNGVQHTIGPDDSGYARFTTGTDGSVAIMSDATDVNASALRVWAAFMDPYERIVVYPDHEWHGRVTQSNANGTVADPARPNLNTAYSFKPDSNTPGSPARKPLFTDSEKTQGTPINNGTGTTNDKPLTFVIRRSDDIFTDFWNWLVSQIQEAVTAIENMIVSVADDIMVGINFIVNGIKLILELPPMFNWLKLLGNETANIVLTVLDAVTCVVVCALDLALVWVKSDLDPRPPAQQLAQPSVRLDQPAAQPLRPAAVCPAFPAP